MNRVLTIIGASVRAAATSAARSGYHVHAADLFADADLRQVCDATRVRRYPSGMTAVVAGPQPGAWMYTGALENHPAQVERMARIRPLWGNSAPVLRRVRNPRLVAKALAENGVRGPRVTFDPGAIPADGTWLSKPRRSAGGAGIACWDRRSSPVSRSAVCYFQQFIEGSAHSAVYVGAGRRARLLGVTRQMVGEPWTGSGGFRYCGSIGPIDLPTTAMTSFAAIGDLLAAEFDLVGLFGVDAIVNSAGVWPVEVNPRYTASVEILERAASLRPIDWHAAACVHHELPAVVEQTGTSMSGKAVLFARSRCEISATWSDWAARARHQGRPWLADIPATGTVIDAGSPLVTVFADGDDETAVLGSLRELARKVLASAHLEVR